MALGYSVVPPFRGSQTYDGRGMTRRSNLSELRDTLALYVLARVDRTVLFPCHLQHNLNERYMWHVNGDLIPISIAPEWLSCKCQTIIWCHW